MTTILVVDDSPTMRLMVRAVLESDPDLQVVGEAADGVQAIELCQSLDPDIITMDIRMPRLNGFEAIQRIMSSWPRPVLVLTSSLSDVELGISFKAVEAGALMILGKPHGMPEADPNARALIDQVKAMATVKVIRRTARFSPASQDRMPVSRNFQTAAGSPQRELRPRSVSVVGIGASTGGPPALQTVLSAGPCGVPVVIVQHISPGFVNSLARWLDQTTPWRVKVGENTERLRPDTVYLAPDDAHLEVAPGGHLVLYRASPVEGHCPSVTRLFQSLARVYGPAAVGIILTGMGHDGTDGLKTLHDGGGYTLAQDETTSVIYSMPKNAVAAGAVDEVLPITQIGERMGAIVAQRESLISPSVRTSEA